MIGHFFLYLYGLNFHFLTKLGFRLVPGKKLLVSSLYSEQFIIEARVYETAQLWELYLDTQ